MCGIAGYFNDYGLDGDDLGRMASAIAHRGSDGDGFYVKSDTGTGLAHRRLAILDLSEMGKQPMTYADSGCWISYNGELYNYIELRAELKALGCSFSTNTDTEVLLASYCMWGIESFSRFNGMFSFAIYDESRNKLLLCRDNFGIKPLYYWRSEQRLVFGSELKVFAAVAGKLGIKWDERAIRTSLTSNYTLESTEFSLFKAVNRRILRHRAPGIPLSGLPVGRSVHPGSDGAFRPAVLCRAAERGPVLRGGPSAPAGVPGIVEKNRRPITCGKVRVAFIARKRLVDVPTRAFNTPRGTVAVSTPEATAIDLAGYPGHAGGLDQVATVLSELAEQIDPELLTQAAATAPVPWAQRLGYLLEIGEASEKASALKAYVADRARDYAPLSSGTKESGALRHQEWKLIINTDVELEI